jgi:hypothetical protein
MIHPQAPSEPAFRQGDVPANLNTSSYLVGPDRQLPPANHTVSLTC